MERQGEGERGRKRMRQLLGRLLKARTTQANRPQAINIVSGLPRSGTSMMMQMLEASGLAVLTDNLRKPDEDNPRGYYEFERVKQLPKGDHGWLEDAQGKAVKVIAALLKHLPPQYNYKVIFMRRRMEEIPASQKQMLMRRGEDPDRVSDEEVARLFEKHLRKVEAWLAAQSHVDVLDVDYNAMLADPIPYARRINVFLGGFLDEKAMVALVDAKLYRNRAE